MKKDRMMIHVTRMICKTLFVATALTCLMHVAHATDGGETVTMEDGSEQLAKAASQATTCQQVNDELNKAMEKGWDTTELKKRKDALCEQTYTAENEKPAEKAEPIPTVELTQAQKDAYKQYSDSMMKYDQKNLAGRPGLEHIPTRIAPGFAYPDDAKEAGYGMSGGANGDFGPRNIEGCSACSKNHMGQDYSLKGSSGAVDSQKEIAAAAQGKVVFAGTQKGYGNVVVVDHGRYQTTYAHLDSINVKQGQSVGYGQVVGIGGDTGVSTAPHLHYGVKDETNRANNGWVDPTNFKVDYVGGNYTTAEGGTNSNPFQIITNSSGNYGNTGNGTNTSTNPNSGYFSNANSGLGSTISNLLGNNGSGSGNPLGQLLSQLFGGGSGGGDSSGESDSGSSGGSSGTTASDIVVKTVTEVAANGDTTRTTTYADGRTESLTIKGSATATRQLEILLAAVLGEEKAAATLASIKALCGSNLSTSADADMLKISSCRGASSV